LFTSGVDIGLTATSVIHTCLLPNHNTQVHLTNAFKADAYVVYLVVDKIVMYIDNAGLQLLEAE
jgi:hypothetical protein